MQADSNRLPADRARPAADHPSDLENIVSCLDLAAITLADNGTKALTADILVTEAMKWGPLVERDIRIVLASGKLRQLRRLHPIVTPKARNA